jgi:hypothetical protein
VSAYVDARELTAAIVSLLDQTDVALLAVTSEAHTNPQPPQLQPLAVLLHDVETIVARFESMRRELRLAVGLLLSQMRPSQAKLVCDTLGLHYERSTQKTTLRRSFVESRLAAQLADEHGAEPPAVLAARAVAAACSLAGVTASTKLRVGQLKEWRLESDDVYDAGDWQPPQAKAVKDAAL